MVEIHLVGLERVRAVRAWHLSQLPKKQQVRLLPRSNSSDFGLAISSVVARVRSALVTDAHHRLVKYSTFVLIWGTRRPYGACHGTPSTPSDPARYRRDVQRHAGAIRAAATAQLSEADVAATQRLLRDAFAADGEGFTDDDWQHATGGLHFLLERDGELLAHASVVERELHVDGRPYRTGYVEAVATRPDVQRQGHGTLLMEAVDGYIGGRYELGALSAARPEFYARLGWEPWLGPTGVRTDRGTIRTPEEDGGIMILRTPRCAGLDRSGFLTCPWRAGDAW